MEDNESSRKESLKLLEKCPSSEVPQLLHSLVDKLCGRKSPSYPQFQHVWSVKEWWTVTDYCTCLLRKAVKHNWTKAKVTEQVQFLDKEYQQAFHEVLLSRRDEIAQRLSQDTCNVSLAHLEDFDWQLKLVVGSDKMANTNIPLASVMFNINEADHQRNLVLEMGKDQLGKFITALENANKIICQFQT